MVDHALILELTKLLDETGLTEIEIEQNGQRVRVARGAVAAAPNPPRAAPPTIRMGWHPARTLRDFASRFTRDYPSLRGGVRRAFRLVLQCRPFTVRLFLVNEVEAACLRNYAVWHSVRAENRSF